MVIAMVWYKANKLNKITTVIILFFILSFFIYCFDSLCFNNNNKSLMQTQQEFDINNYDGLFMNSIHKDIKNIIAYELSTKYISQNTAISYRSSEDKMMLSSVQDEFLIKLPAFLVVFNASCFLIYHRCRKWFQSCIVTLTFLLQFMIDCLHKRDGKKRTILRYSL